MCIHDPGIIRAVRSRVKQAATRQGGEGAL
jgi:hypothetical protein